VGGGLVTLGADGTWSKGAGGSGAVTFAGLGGGLIGLRDTIDLSFVTDAGALAALDTITLSLVSDAGTLAALNSVAWGTHITGRPTELTDGRITTALDASGILQTSIPNAAQIPTLDATKISTGTFADARIAESSVTQHQGALAISSGQVSGLGSLATLSTVANAQIAAAAAIAQTKIDYPFAEDTIAGNTTVTSAVNVCEIQFTNVGSVNFVFFTQSLLASQSTAASATSCVLRWTLRESASSGVTNGGIICEGEVTYTGSPVGEAGNDFAEIAVRGGPYSLSLTGTVYVALVLEVTSGGGEEAYVQSATKLRGTGLAQIDT